MITLPYAKIESQCDSVASYLFSEEYRTQTLNYLSMTKEELCAELMEKDRSSVKEYALQVPLPALNRFYQNLIAIQSLIYHLSFLDFKDDDYDISEETNAYYNSLQTEELITICNSFYYEEDDCLQIIKRRIEDHPAIFEIVFSKLENEELLLS